MGVHLGVPEKVFLKRQLSRDPKECATQVPRDRVFLAKILEPATNIMLSDLTTGDLGQLKISQKKFFKNSEFV